MLGDDFVERKSVPDGYCFAVAKNKGNVFVIPKELVRLGQKPGKALRQLTTIVSPRARSCPWVLTRAYRTRRAPSDAALIGVLCCQS
jgi:hypothetical protein